jgi:hypothetical protein
MPHRLSTFWKTPRQDRGVCRRARIEDEFHDELIHAVGRHRSPVAAPGDVRAEEAGHTKACDQPDSGLANPATSLTRSA